MTAPTVTDEIMALHHQLDGVTSGLGYHELRALIALAKRIRMGQEQYGELYIGKRDWVKELVDEALDLVIYGAFRDVLGNPPHEGEGGNQ